jgi:putative ABC transport system permease protein
VLLWTIVLSALKSLWANKMRSFLAMLGIIIGVGAVIAMLAMGTGAQVSITERFQSMGTNLLFIRPAQKGTGGVITGMAQTLVVEDAVALASVEGVSAVSPVVQGAVQAKYLNSNSRVTIIGGAMPYFVIRNMEVEKGRAFTESEAESTARVTVIGSTVATNLFGGEDPLGKVVKYNNISFTVIGVLKSKGDQGFNNPDEQALIPYTTAMKIMFGLDYLREIDIQVADGFDQGAVSGQPKAVAGGMGPPRPNRSGTIHFVDPPSGSVTALLRKRHRLSDLSMPDDFNIQNQAELLENLSASLLVFRILLSGIAAISLLVGGIGIMNIMLVTVTERTREIGTRKAIGAKNRDIMLQFLVESMVMCGLGGAIGATFGILLAKVIPLLPGLSSFIPIVQPFVVVGAIAVAALVGLGSGLYPAFRASLLDPIEALRYE